MCVRSKMLAVERCEVDPFLDDTGRSDDWLRPHIKHVFAKLAVSHGWERTVESIAGKNGSIAKIEEGLRSFEKSLVSSMRLVAPSTLTLPIATVDALFTTADRTMSTALKGEAAICVPLAKDAQPSPRVVLTLNDDDRHIEVELTLANEHTITLTTTDVVPIPGPPRSIDIKLGDPAVHDDIHALRNHAPPPTSSSPTPTAQSSTTSSAFCQRVVDFLREGLRLHVLVQAASPKSASPRTLILDHVRRFQTLHQSGLIATLHPSSVSCLCSAHGKERCENARVEVALALCGKALKGPSKYCPLHQTATPSTPFSVCCHSTIAAISCRHSCVNADNKPSYSNATTMKATLSDEAIDTLRHLLLDHTDDSPDARPCTPCPSKLPKPASKRKRDGGSMEDLDARAVELLRENNSVQYKRHGSQHVVLAREIPNEQNPAPYTLPDSQLYRSHLWFFPRRR